MPIAQIDTIPSGFRGTEETVKRMHDLVLKAMTDLKFQHVTDMVISADPKCSDRDYTCKTRKIFDFVKSFVRFERDPFGIEMIQDPMVTLNRRAGDCDDHVILITSMAGTIGLPYAFKTIKADKLRPDEFSHIYALVNVPGKGWVSLDTSVSWSYYGWEAPGKHSSHVWPPRVD